MAFILDAQRDADCSLAFQLYRKYLDENQRLFPASAYRLASSDWWYDFNDKRCPHDGIIDRVEIRESESEDAGRELTMSVVLRGAWNGDRLEIRYCGVAAYDLAARSPELENGHGDWRYDEFRVSKSGLVVHEIEWGDGAHWIIECRDIEYDQAKGKSEQTDGLNPGQCRTFGGEHGCR